MATKRGKKQTKTTTSKQAGAQKARGASTSTATTKKKAQNASARKPATAGDAERIKRILEILDEMYPDATTELRWRTPWELLVATILSAQCTDERVNKVTPVLFQRFPTVQDMARADVKEVAEIIRPTGYFNNKAKAIVGAAKMLVERFGGEVPRTMDEMLQLPGVARKTANVVLGTAYGIPSGVVVDTHVERVARRLGLTTEKNRDKIEQQLMEIIPKERWIKFSHQLILHGRYVCTARKPKCAECRLEPYCYSEDKTFWSQPASVSKPAVTAGTR